MCIPLDFPSCHTCILVFWQCSKRIVSTLNLENVYVILMDSTFTPSGHRIFSGPFFIKFSVDRQHMFSDAENSAEAYAFITIVIHRL